MRSAILAVALLLATTSAFGRRPQPTPASALADGGPVDLGEANKALAKGRYALAQKLFAEQKYAEAIIQYGAAHDAWALDGFYFNIAQCHRNLGHVDEAIDYFQRYVSAPNVKNRGEVEQLIAELRLKRAADANHASAASAPGGYEDTATSPAAASVITAPPAAVAPAAIPKSEAAPATRTARATASATAQPMDPAARAASVTALPAVAPAGETRITDDPARRIVITEVPPTPSVAMAPAPSAASAGSTPVYTHAWFWVTTLGALLVAGGSVGVAAYGSPQLPAGSLGTADWR